MVRPLMLEVYGTTEKQKFLLDVFDVLKQKNHRQHGVISGEFVISSEFVIVIFSAEQKTAFTDKFLRKKCSCDRRAKA